jgi:hypothetical protein
MVRDGSLVLSTDTAGWMKLDAEVLDWLPDEVTIQAATARALAYIPHAIARIPVLLASSIEFLQTKFPHWLPGLLAPPLNTFVVGPLLARPFLEPLDPPPLVPSPVDALRMYNQYKLRFNLPF